MDLGYTNTMTFRLSILLTLIFCLIQAGLTADPTPPVSTGAPASTHAATGLTFPAEIAGMKFEVETNDEAKTPGLGIRYSYRAESIKADIYLYTGGHSTILAGPKSAVIQQYFDQAVGDVETMGQLGHFKNVSVKTRDQVTYGVPFLRAILHYTQETPRISHLYLTGYKNHVLKVRLTHLESESANVDSQINAFWEFLGSALKAK